MFTTVFFTNTLQSARATRYNRGFLRGGPAAVGLSPVPSIRKTPEVLGPALSWAGVPGASVGGSGQA